MADKIREYWKFLSALVAAVIVVIPAYQAAQTDGVSLGEWMTLVGLFVPAVAVALSPANQLPTKELVDQAIKDPNINLEVKGNVVR
jgi:hypothetical protein